LLKKHKDENRAVELLKTSLKKLYKELKTVELDYERLNTALSSTQNTFSQRIRSALINSNRRKYLVCVSSDKNIPCYVVNSRLVSTDTSVLQRHYKAKLPTDLKSVSPLWVNIIDFYNTKYNRTVNLESTSICSKLESKGIHFPLQKSASPSHFSNFDLSDHYQPFPTNTCTSPSNEFQNTLLVRTPSKSPMSKRSRGDTSMTTTEVQSSPNPNFSSPSQYCKETQYYRAKSPSEYPHSLYSPLYTNSSYLNPNLPLYPHSFPNMYMPMQVQSERSGVSQIDPLGMLPPRFLASTFPMPTIPESNRIPSPTYLDNTDKTDKDVTGSSKIFRPFQL
jgi:hypothetical protein